MKIDLDRVESLLELPDGWHSNVYDPWDDVHDAHLEVVAPGNEGAGYVMWRVKENGEISSVCRADRAPSAEVVQAFESLRSAVLRVKDEEVGGE